MSENVDYKKAYLRQRKAREKAESLLESRARELYEINQSLQTVYETLNRQKDQLVQQEKLAAKSEFLSLMSHEIKTPLNSIIAMSYMLDEMELDADATKATDIILKSSEHLLSLIKSLLDFAKFEASRTNLNPRDVHLFKLLDDIGEICCGDLDLEKVSYSLTVDDDVPDRIRIDELKLKQILLNLLGNAVKFTSAGTIKLMVSLRTDEGREHLVFCIKDTGIGIKAEEFDKLFEPFTQADTSKTRAYGGTGLGLSIALSYSRLMGGNIAVDSTPGAGSEFNFHCAFERSQESAGPE